MVPPAAAAAAPGRPQRIPGSSGGCRLVHGVGKERAGGGGGGGGAVAVGVSLVVGLARSLTCHVYRGTHLSCAFFSPPIFFPGVCVKKKERREREERRKLQRHDRKGEGTTASSEGGWLTYRVSSHKTHYSFLSPARIM